MSEQTGNAVGAGDGYCQLFVYRVPRENHERFGAVEGELAALFRKSGMLRSDFYVVEDARIFQGFRDLRDALGATPDEEVWVELDYYRDEEDSRRVIGEIGKDPTAGPLFAQVLQLASPGALSLQGNASRVGL